mgnify:CR=1 FL=1
MNKIAFREKPGDWIYYLTWFTYKEVSTYVKKIDKELHQSKSLNDMIQRSLTENVDRIASYIEKQPERFFNALVLAVYDGDPQWREVELDYGNGEKYDLGVLELSGEEKIFPVDGQHRVEGIKRVLERNKDKKYDSETIPVILIGHKKTAEGMQRTRRLFSTLNRYAKPVTLNDIISLDEDDIIAIATRHLIENNPLFHEERLINQKQKAIPKSDKTAYTNIISLYECNTELLAYFIKDKIVYFNHKQLRGKRKIQEYCRLRPSEEEISTFITFTDTFWGAFSQKIDEISQYLSIDIKSNPAADFRNEQGGSLLFRPVGQRPFVRCALALYDLSHDMNSVMAVLNKVKYSIEDKLWESIVWNPISKKMITSSNATLIEYMLKYFTRAPMTDIEIKKMVDEYKSMKGDPALTKEEILQTLDKYIVI